MNRPDYYDEVGVFLGASYFRAVAKGEVYGLSARGLAINTAEPKGEEFPLFKTFWIEKPQPKTNSIVVHALLDSKSATAAYRFTIRPGTTTVYDVEMNLYPRVDIPEVGIAPMTSMFFFDANDRDDVDDFRPAVHDSDGLYMRNGHDERLWRVLTNPNDLQISSFNDTNPRNFGLMQRQRDFRAYQDLKSHFEKRPSLQVEPIGDWGNGQVRLIEIPTKSEIHDNIVSFWHPKDPLRAKGEYAFTYRLHWGSGDTGKTLAKFVKTRCGAAGDSRLFVLDLIGENLNERQCRMPWRRMSAPISAKSRMSWRGRITETGGWRLSFQSRAGWTKSRRIARASSAGRRAPCPKPGYTDGHPDQAKRHVQVGSKRRPSCRRKRRSICQSKACMRPVRRHCRIGAAVSARLASRLCHFVHYCDDRDRRRPDVSGAFGVVFDRA